MIIIKRLVTKDNITRLDTNPMKIYTVKWPYRQIQTEKQPDKEQYIMQIEYYSFKGTRKITANNFKTFDTIILFNQNKDLDIIRTFDMSFF